MMFAGVISRDGGEPWGPTGMTTAKWRDVPVQLVRVSDLIVTQKGIEFGHLIADRVPFGADPFPHVVRWRGKWYLEDGHHRAVRWAMKGLPEFLARVLVIEDEAEAQAA